MIRQSTIDKLHDLRLSAMSDAFECQCRDPETYQGLSFEDRFGMLVDKEWDKRKSTKLQKLIRSAEFRYPNACMEDIEYHPDRNLDKGQMLEFSTCRYISDDHHIILKGASGNGKTYIACALGIAACRNFIKVRYVRLPDLLNELAVAHIIACLCADDQLISVCRKFLSQDFSKIFLRTSGLWAIVVCKVKMSDPIVKCCKTHLLHILINTGVSEIMP